MNLDFLYDGKLHGSLGEVPKFTNLSSWRPLEGQTGIRGLAGVLREEEWKAFDTRLIEIARQRMNAMADLMSRGLTYNVNNAMGTTVLEWETVTEMPDAQVSMDAVTRGPNERLEFNLQTLPLPIVHEDFYLNERHLSASRNIGSPLDTTMMEQAGRKVVEKLEQIVLDGVSNLTFGGASIEGYTNYTNRQTKSFSSGKWDGSGSASDILTDVLAMKQSLIDNRRYGPYVIYIPTAYETVLDEDYDSTTATGRTIRERILEINGIEAIKVNDFLTADNVLMVQLTRDVVDLVNGFQPRVLQWNSEGGMLHHFKVMAIMVPRLKADADSRSGVVHMT